VVGASFDQSVLQGQFGEVPQFVALLFFGETVYDVEGFLLAFVDAEPFEALSLFDGVVGVGHVDVVDWAGRAGILSSFGDARDGG
jgi:hypothetical protein